MSWWKSFPLCICILSSNIFLFANRQKILQPSDLSFYYLSADTERHFIIFIVFCKKNVAYVKEKKKKIESFCLAHESGEEKVNDSERLLLVINCYRLYVRHSTDMHSFENVMGKIEKKCSKQKNENVKYGEKKNR